MANSEDLEIDQLEPVSQAPKRKLKVNKKTLFLFIGGIIIGLIAGSAIFVGLNITGGTVGVSSTVDAKGQLTKYLDQELATRGMAYTIRSCQSDGAISKCSVLIKTADGKDNPTEIAVTNDGKYVIPGAALMATAETTQPAATDNAPASPQPSAPAVPKSDKPAVELFVMSYCPFGLQAEKGILPALKLLGNKIDFTLRFVNYAMHGEKELTENTRQYCIQKEQKDKLFDYLNCFAADGNADACIAKAKIDKGKLDACIAKADKEFNITALFNDTSSWVSGRFPKYLIDSKLNEKYGIQGSPGFIINGQEASDGNRAPADYLKAICAAFNKQPAECSQNASTTAPAPGIGGGAAAAANSGSAGTCG